MSDIPYTTTGTDGEYANGSERVAELERDAARYRALRAVMFEAEIAGGYWWSTEHHPDSHETLDDYADSLLAQEQQDYVAVADLLACPKCGAQMSASITCGVGANYDCTCGYAWSSKQDVPEVGK